MTRQQEADNMLSFWQAQRAAGIRPEDRLLSEGEYYDLTDAIAVAMHEAAE